MHFRTHLPEISDEENKEESLRDPICGGAGGVHVQRTAEWASAEQLSKTLKQ